MNDLKFVGATVTRAALGPVAAIAFGDGSRIELYANVSVFESGKLSGRGEDANEFDGAGKALSRIVGLEVTGADIGPTGVLSIELADSFRIEALPVDDAESYIVRQPTSPTQIVCGFGGEMFVWD